MVGFSVVRVTRCVLSIFCGLLLAGAPVWALEFTADRITKMDSRIGKAGVYYRDDWWRIEHHATGPVNVSMVRKDKRVVWFLLSRMKHFKTMPYSAEQDLMVAEALDGEISREQIGTEMRKGHPTSLYEVTTKQGELVESYLWVATDLHFPMKIAKKNGSWTWSISM